MLTKVPILAFLCLTASLGLVVSSSLTRPSNATLAINENGTTSSDTPLRTSASASEPVKKVATSRWVNNNGSNPDPFEQCFAESKSSNENNLALGPQEHSMTLIKGSHKFSLDLLKSLSNFESKDTSDGLLISPFSVWSALIATYMGARGDTEKEIRRVLEIEDIPKQSVGMAYQGLQYWYRRKNSSTSHNRKFSYAAANRIFISDKLQLNNCIKEHFTNEVESMNFAEPVNAADTINKWVSQLTMGKIKQLISPGGLSPWTQIIVANAVYFHSQWLYKFDGAKNERKDFHVSPSETMEATYMTQTGNFMYGISEKLGATIIDLPYANQQFSMVVILPDNSRGVDRVIKTLRADDLHELLNNMFEDELLVSMPKFKMEQEFDLAGPLYSMGVKKLFDPRYADVGGFFNATIANYSAQKGATINSVIHKASITVNEEGTEAAAATAFLMARSGRPAFPTRFIADRPFLYIIRDTATNVILFIGAVRRPN
ncbi:Serpin B6 [Halotydeus destructor]|nr:Serpin B6 [Halotydeus destructor]